MKINENTVSNIIKSLKKSKMIQFIYWYVIPFGFIFLTTKSLYKINNLFEYLKMAIMYFLLSFPLFVTYVLIGIYIFERKKSFTLAEKIIHCELRKKYGYDYCVKCKDSYACSTDSINKN